MTQSRGAHSPSQRRGPGVAPEAGRRDAEPQPGDPRPENSSSHAVALRDMCGGTTTNGEMFNDPQPLPRPRLPEERRHNRCFTMAMTPAESDALTRLADARGCKKAAIVREALRRYLMEIDTRDRSAE